MENLQLIKSALLERYLYEVGKLSDNFDALEEAEISNEQFSFYTSVASVYSSKIEGEIIDLDSYIKHRITGASFQPDYTKKTDDLYEAYLFAKSNNLNAENLFKAHQLLARNLLSDHQLGRFRSSIMYVTTIEGKIEYVAAAPGTVVAEMDKWFSDIKLLLESDLPIEEVFYYAAYAHFTFVKIHPWFDGNGRTARLIEKWFLSEKLGHKAWYLQSEKHYYQNHELYYQNLRKAGLEYELLDHSKLLDFLLMLPKSL